MRNNESMIDIFFTMQKMEMFLAIQYDYVYQVIFFILLCYLFPFSCIKRKNKPCFGRVRN